MTRLFNIVDIIHQTLRKAPGDALSVQVDTPIGDNREIEYYQLPGYAAGPTVDDQAVAIQAGGYRVVIASHNYRLSVPIDPGQVKIYSTNADGDTLEASITLDTDGTVTITNTDGGEVKVAGSDVELNGNSKAFVTHSELDTALQTFVTALNTHVHPTTSPGAPTLTPTPTMSIDISGAATSTVKTGG